MKKLVVILVVLLLSKNNFAMEVTPYGTIVNHTTWNQLLKKQEQRRRVSIKIVL